MADTQQSPRAVFTCGIPDMECVGCAAHVEEALEAIPGVEAVSLGVVGRRATVHYDPRLVGAGQLIEAIRGAGHEVRQEDDGAGAPDDARLALVAGRPWSRRALLTAASGVLLASALAMHLLRPEPDHAALWQGHFGPVDLLYGLAALVGGLNFLPRALRALRHLSLEMDFLMSAAIVGAVVIGEPAEAAAIAFLYSVAELLEEHAVGRARRSLGALVSLAPRSASVRRDGRESVVSANEVCAGDTVLLRPGDRLPVDGVVVSGTSAIDQSTITGESMPVTRAPGDEVYAGTLNHEGYLEVRATRAAADSALSRIVSMVEEAEERRAPSERFVRRFARYYTPAVTLAAVALMVLPPLLAGAPLQTWFGRGLALLVIACPCALVISTPVAVVSAITAAARHGALIKGGNHLEDLARVTVVALDKTGTVTTGRPGVRDVVALDGTPAAEVLRLAAAVEQHSKHPVARAIVAAAGDTDLPQVSGFESITGLGVRADLADGTYWVGKAELFSPAAIADADARGLAALTSTVLVGRRDRVLGAIAVADRMRPAARRTVQQLRQRGLRVVMLTGDGEETARSVAEELGIDEWHAGLLPQDKVAQIERLEREHGPVAMVGDGVNDAPALAAATVGMAMGAVGSDVALETADVALMGDELDRLPYLVDLSRRARRVIRQNVWASILTKVLLAAGVVPGLVGLAAAVLIGDMGTTLGVTTNALRLSRLRPAGSIPTASRA